jgi:hypothetical protein
MTFDEVALKLGINSQLHYDKVGEGYKILIEMLNDNGLISCIRIRKWDENAEYN